MRQKKIKYATRELMEAYDVITLPKMLDLKDDRPVFIEIGSGKGQFITSLARDIKAHLYIALEMNINVCYRILEKKNELKLDNLIIILGDAKDLDLYLSPHSLDGIYLNFSDPWPKARHHKRRLTYPPFLKHYQSLLKPNGFLQFRTDHLEMFMDSLNYLEPYFLLHDVTYDLKASKYMTEYEEKKRKIGPIYQAKGMVNIDVKESI